MAGLSRTKVNRKLRIAYLIEQLYPGGAERQLLELLRRLNRDRYDPVVIAGGGDGFLVDEIRQLGVPLEFVRGKFGGGKLATLAVIAEIRRARPDIIHAYAFTANSWGALAKPFARDSKLVAGVRGPSNAAGVQKLAERLLRNVPDISVSNSHYFRAEMIQAGISPDRIRVIPNGIDLAAYPYPADRAAARSRLGISANVPVVGMVASFRPLKRWDLFLQAVAGLKKELAVHVVCIGDGTSRPEMERLASDLGIGGSTIFLGTRSDVPTLLPALDVLVSASDIEGLSNSILEAMASGVAIIGTAVGGTPELIADGNTGLLVRPNDAQALRDALDSLLSNGELSASMGAAARRRAEREFSLDRCVSETEALYEWLIANNLKLTAMAGFKGT